MSGSLAPPLSAPLRILVSACLAGQSVRYNGAHKHAPDLLRALAAVPVSPESGLFDLRAYFPFLALAPEIRFVCPETECGLGVPREPMRLEGDPRRPSVVTLNSRQDHTERLSGFTRARIRDLDANPPDAAVLKKGSPSCGARGVPVYPGPGEDGALSGRGLFARAFGEAFPLAPVAQENELASRGAVERFLLRAALARVWSGFAQNALSRFPMFSGCGENVFALAFGLAGRDFIRNFSRMSPAERASVFRELLDSPMSG